MIGTLAETINPFSKQMRGMLAYALVEGQGLMFDEMRSRSARNVEPDVSARSTPTRSSHQLNAIRRNIRHTSSSMTNHATVCR